MRFLSLFESVNVFCLIHWDKSTHPGGTPLSEPRILKVGPFSSSQPFLVLLVNCQSGGSGGTPSKSLDP